MTRETAAYIQGYANALHSTFQAMDDNGLVKAIPIVVEQLKRGNYYSPRDMKSAKVPSYIIDFLQPILGGSLL